MLKDSLSLSLFDSYNSGVRGIPTLVLLIKEGRLCH